MYIDYDDEENDIIRIELLPKILKILKIKSDTFNECYVDIFELNKFQHLESFVHRCAILTLSKMTDLKKFVNSKISHLNVFRFNLPSLPNKLTSLSLYRDYFVEIPPLVTKLSLTYIVTEIQTWPIHLRELTIINGLKIEINNWPRNLEKLIFENINSDFVIVNLPLSLKTLIFYDEDYSVYNKSFVLPDKLEYLDLPEKYFCAIEFPKTLKYAKVPLKYFKQIPRNCKLVSLM